MSIYQTSCWNMVLHRKSKRYFKHPLKPVVSSMFSSVVSSRLPVRWADWSWEDASRRHRSLGAEFKFCARDCWLSLGDFTSAIMITESSKHGGDRQPAAACSSTWFWQPGTACQNVFLFSRWGWIPVSQQEATQTAVPEHTQKTDWL